MSHSRAKHRVAIVAGCRTPFAKSGTSLSHKSAVDLACLAVVELINRSNLDCTNVSQMFFGQVVASPLAPNLAREVSLLPQFPRTIPAITVNAACASANQAIVLGHDQIVQGQADVVVAGGAESLSDIPILHSKRLSQMLVKMSRSKTALEKAKLISSFQPRDVLPITPTISEPSTGETMGEAAERMAKVNGISREDQDRFALRSHRLAAAAMRNGKFATDIAPLLEQGAQGPVVTDNGIRPDTSLEGLARLEPVFDKKHGTVTAGTSSPLTDGAGAVLLMSEEKAISLGYEPLAFVKSYSFVAIDPGDQSLMGPAFAIPQALERAGVAWSEIGLVEMHEAFAAQVLSNINAIESKQWAQDNLGAAERIGEVDWENLNPMGGSIALGHPFGATGARMTLMLATEMKRRDVQFGLLTTCAQGGMGFAMILERS